MNEAEVRFHIIDPIIRKLGYGEPNNGTYLHLEEQLETLFYHIGRKSKKDFPIGRPDYCCGLAGRRGSFIVEAKSSDQEIDQHGIGQAHSYAAHVQISANLFVLCNGVYFAVFETLAADISNPVLRINCSDIDARFHEIESVLGPRQLERKFQVRYEIGLKLSDDLPPRVDVLGGKYDVQSCSIDIVGASDEATALLKSLPQMQQLEDLRKFFLECIYTIETGVVARGDDGRIAADIRFGAITKNNTLAMQAIGLDRTTFFTASKFVSQDPANPTLFEAEKTSTVEKGSKVFPLVGDPLIAQMDIMIDVYFASLLHKTKGGFAGEYVAFAEYQMEIPLFGRATLGMNLFGSCEIRTST